MGRLIDADKLKADLEKAISKNEDMDCLDFLCVASVIDDQPTVYDPYKVVEQLEGLSNAEADYYYASCNDVIDREDAIEIVKGGGVDAGSI